MTNPVAVRRSETDGPGGEVIGAVVWLWCPGCDQAHRFPVGSVDPARTQWEWNGNLEKPTFTPSYLTWRKTWDAVGNRSEDHRCHSYVTDGTWNFLGDSTHRLAGTTTPLVPLPDWLVGHAGS